MILLVLTFFWFVIPIIPLYGWLVGVHKKEKWETIPLHRLSWPPDVQSHTYKRAAGQHLVWLLFGNESEGVVPWFRGKQWSFWRWQLRNKCHNLLWHWLGYAWYEEGNPYGPHYKGHLVSRYPLKKNWIIFSLVKPRRRPWFYWRPWLFLRGNLIWWHLYFWYGWKAYSRSSSL